MKTLQSFLMNWSVILFLLPGIAVMWAQTPKTIHRQQLEEHRHDTIDVFAIDREAASRPLRVVRNRTLTTDIVGYLPFWEYSCYPDLRYDLLTQINYFAAELNEFGDIVDSHNWDDLGFIEYAQQQGVKVKFTAVLYGSDNLSSFLNSVESRQNAIDNLLTSVLTAGADGVDIDFELLPALQRDHMTDFMTDLTDALHSQIPGSQVTMATPPVDWGAAWDYDALANTTDGLFIMGYNYHWSGSSSAGPVSPLGGFFYDLEYTVEDYLVNTGNNREKLILGLPYFAYNWPVYDSTMYSETTGTGSALTYSEAKVLSETVGSNRDQFSQTPWMSYQDEQWRQCWYDDSLSLSVKLDLVNENQLFGAGIWALGYDGGNEELWNVLEAHFSGCFSTGDANLDGFTDILDIVMILDHILSGVPLSGEPFCQSDLTNDFQIDINDIVILVDNILNGG